jgi:hypothetical protein
MWDKINSMAEVEEAEESISYISNYLHLKGKRPSVT